jgi:hypothetical protein
LLWFWWGGFLLLWILNRAAAQEWNSAAQAATVHSLRSATRLDIASEAVSIVTAGLAIAVVRTLTRRQTERARAD